MYPSQHFLIHTHYGATIDPSSCRDPSLVLPATLSPNTLIMPPKIAQKRLRESTAENGSTSPAIGTAAVAGGEDRVGEGASTIRRTGASSISSDTAASGDGDDGDNPPRMKRSRRSDRPKQQQSDGEQQQEDKDVVMEDEQEGRQAGAGAAWGVAAAGSSKKPASGRRVTTASRRKGSIDSSGGDHTEEVCWNECSPILARAASDRYQHI